MLRSRDSVGGNDDPVPFDPEVPLLLALLEVVLVGWMIK